VTAKDMWGDGFYVSDASNVTFCGVTADRNRRQGLSVIKADGLVVLNSVFQNTRGTRPGAGIDFEPDDRDVAITGVRIENSKFLKRAQRLRRPHQGHGSSERLRGGHRHAL
jgi:hypothetical protein